MRRSHQLAGSTHHETLSPPSHQLFLTMASGRLPMITESAGPPHRRRRWPRSIRSTSIEPLQGDGRGRRPTLPLEGGGDAGDLPERLAGSGLAGKGLDHQPPAVEPENQSQPPCHRGMLLDSRIQPTAFFTCSAQRMEGWKGPDRSNKAGFPAHVRVGRGRRRDRELQFPCLHAPP